MRGLCGIKDGVHAGFFGMSYSAQIWRWSVEWAAHCCCLLFPLSLAPALDHSTILSLARYRVANRIISFIHIPSGFDSACCPTIQAKILIYNSNKTRLDFCSLPRVRYTFDRYCSTVYIANARQSAPSSLRLTVEARKVRGSFWCSLRSKRLADSCTPARFDQR